MLDSLMCLCVLSVSLKKKTTHISRSQLDHSEKKYLKGKYLLGNVCRRFITYICTAFRQCMFGTEIDKEKRQIVDDVIQHALPCDNLIITISTIYDLPHTTYRRLIAFSARDNT